METLELETVSILYIIKIRRICRRIIKATKEEEGKGNFNSFLSKNKQLLGGIRTFMLLLLFAACWFACFYNEY